MTNTPLIAGQTYHLTPDDLELVTCIYAARGAGEGDLEIAFKVAAVSWGTARFDYTSVAQTDLNEIDRRNENEDRCPFCGAVIDPGTGGVWRNCMSCVDQYPCSRVERLKRRYENE